MIEAISRIEETAALAGSTVSGAGAASRSFAESIEGLVNEVNDQVVGADQEIRKLAVGEADSLHHVLISIEEAKVSLGLMVQVRNRLVEAYQEVLRMQI